MNKENKKVKYLPWGTKVFISGAPVWLDSEIVKDVTRQGQRKSDKEMYINTHKQMEEGNFKYGDTEWTVVAIVKRDEKDYYILRNGFENVVIAQTNSVYKNQFSGDIIMSNNTLMGSGSISIPYSKFHYNNMLKLCGIDTKQEKQELVICGPHTKLIKGNKTYSTTCLTGDTMDREKAVMLLLLQSMGVSYGKITRLIEDAKVYEWNDRKTTDKDDIKNIAKNIDYLYGGISSDRDESENDLADIANLIKDIDYPETPAEDYEVATENVPNPIKEVDRGYLRLERVNSYEFKLSYVSKMDRMSTKIIYISKSSDLYADIMAWLSTREKTVFNKAEGVVVGDKNKLAGFVTLYNIGLEHVKNENVELFNWVSFPNPTEMSLALTTIGDQKLRVTYMMQKDRNNVRTRCKDVTRDNVPISGEEAKYFNAGVEERILEPNSIDYAHWARFQANRFENMRELFISKRKEGKI